MSIRDDDLILYHYRDGLAPERLREIASALAASPELAARYQRLRQLLAAADADALPPYDPDLEARLWQRLQPRLAEAPAAATASAPRATARAHARPRRRLRAWGAGLAATAALALAIYLPFAGRDPMPPAEPVAAQPAAPVPARAPEGAGNDRADRVLDAYVAGHLRSTEGLLLSVVNNEGGALAPMDPAYVRDLVDDNRLYAAAAAERGDRALAGFLHSLEPTLIELANRTPAAGVEQENALRDYVDGSDLVFQVRAVEARLQQRSGSAAAQEGATT
ncbi:hypothetical protein ASE35_08225 [Lysobacter sp. Root916]|uniref:hypothetical protein n=1 Tax=Lysobacter sp. Root916 TaxID=1736606 RepID=UPI00070B87EB|nr:hypothetical protein [Lysobacter sp. Root916]KRD34714.1 hypothetical protein ASE35_08225 [Lysobacter sp. Root916]